LPIGIPECKSINNIVSAEFQNLVSDQQLLLHNVGTQLHIEVFWVVMPCSVVVGYQNFGGPPEPLKC